MIKHLKSSAHPRRHIDTYNNGVGSILKKLKACHHDVKEQVFDTAPAFRMALESPERYGAPNKTCFSIDGVSCLWTDYFQADVAIQELMAEDLVKETGFF